MKISQKQAQLLATQVVEELKKKKTHRVPDQIKSKLREFMTVREDLLNAEKKAEQIRRSHDSKLKEIVGNQVRAEPYWTFSKIVEAIEEKNIPKVSDVQDQIVLQAMFKSDVDMETFIASIVKKFEKKLNNRIPATN
jgi:hypothetical protein